MSRVFLSIEEMVSKHKLPEVLIKKFGNPLTMTEGGGGKIYITDQKWAIKYIKCARLDQLCYIAEYSRMNYISSPHIMRGLEMGICSDALYYVMDEALPLDRETLSSRSQEEIKYIFWQMCLAVYELHRHGLVHYDIKSNNFVIHDSKVKIIDFGLSQFHLCVDNGNDVNKNTDDYRSPELAFDICASEKADIWALGITLFTAVTGKYPYGAKNDATLRRQFATKSGDQIPTEWRERLDRKFHLRTFTSRSPLKVINDPTVRDLLSKLLTVDYRVRPSIYEILNHSYFAEFNSNFIIELPSHYDILKKDMLEFKKTDICEQQWKTGIANLISFSKETEYPDATISYGATLFLFLIQHHPKFYSKTLSMTCGLIGASLYQSGHPNVDGILKISKQRISAIKIDIETILLHTNGMLIITHPYVILNSTNDSDTPCNPPHEFYDYSFTQINVWDNVMKNFSGKVLIEGEMKN